MFINFYYLIETEIKMGACLSNKNITTINKLKPINDKEPSKESVKVTDNIVVS